MGVPTHAASCETKLWATQCPDCQSRVFFFSCSCGSKVFFDMPMPPWPLHQDGCLPYMIRVLRDVEKMSLTDIRRMVENYSRRNLVEIPQDIHRMLLADENRETGKQTIVELLPESTETTLVGAIVSVNEQVNFLKRLGYPDNPISKGLIGDLGAEAHVEVTVRTDRDPTTGFANQLKCVYPKRRFGSSGLRHGSRVVAYVGSRALPNGTWIWVASELYSR